jgi:putative DNA-invertase from lambdoid prophage Rac
MIAALYVRVSTSDQNYAAQVDELKRYCKGRGWKYSVFADEMSGARADRPQLAAVMEAASKRLIDVVLVSKLDRFGRSVADLVNNLRQLESAGVRFLAVTQGIDTDTENPVNKLILHVLGAVAEFERELIRERVRAGVARAKQNGVSFGRREKIFRRDSIHTMRKRGYSIRRIAGLLKVGVATVQRELKKQKE